MIQTTPDPLPAGIELENAPQSHPLLRFAFAFTDLWNKWPQNKSVAVALVLVVVGSCLLRSVAGMAGLRDYSHDAFFLLDGAWRMMNQQRPHADFSSMVGPVAYVPTILGLWISGGLVQGFAYGVSLAALFLTAWIFFLGRSRLAQPALFLLCLAAAVMAASPFFAGLSPLQTTPAETYNRYGWVLLACVLIEGAVLRRNASERSDFLGGLSTGTIPVILAFLKITYLFSSIALIGVLIPCRRQSKARWAGMVTGAATMLMIVSSYYKFNLMPVFKDLQMMAGAKHIFWQRYSAGEILQDAGIVLALAVSAALLLICYGNEASARRVWVAGMAVSLVGSLTIFGNAEPAGFPLAIFFAIILVDALNSVKPIQRQISIAFHASLLLLASALIVFPLLAGWTSMLAAIYGRFRTAPHFAKMDAERLHGFVTEGDDAPYTLFVNDGFKLLYRERRGDETVMCLDFTNPFSYGLGIKPAAGGANGLQHKSSFNDTHHQTAEALFGAADLVMVPKIFSDGSLDDSIPRLYGAYLKSHFRLIGESKQWRLYRNRGISVLSR